MKEISFLKKNAGKWQSYEKVLEDKNAHDPDTLADVFVQLTDDLAYARTFFPESKTEQFLNELAAQVHQSIYKNKKEKLSRITKFWTLELPLLFYQHRKELLTSLIIAAVAVLIAVVSQKNDPDFVNLILGDYYVSMTVENIENGDPMGVYKTGNPIIVAGGIAINNIRVAFLTFILGVLFSLGAAWMIIRTGIMVGSFFYFFHQYDVAKDAYLGVLLHGTLELWAIVVGGAAGFILGNSILFPKSYSRVDSLKVGFKKGLKIIVGMVPVFLVAAFIEGFITRLTDIMPNWLNLSIIFGSLFFIVWYFFILPVIVMDRLGYEKKEIFGKNTQNLNAGLLIALSIILFFATYVSGMQFQIIMLIPLAIGAFILGKNALNNKTEEV